MLVVWYPLLQNLSCLNTDDRVSFIWLSCHPGVSVEEKKTLPVCVNTAYCRLICSVPPHQIVQVLNSWTFSDTQCTHVFFVKFSWLHCIVTKLKELISEFFHFLVSACARDWVKKFMTIPDEKSFKKREKGQARHHYTTARQSTALFYKLSFLFKYLQARNLYKPGISMQNKQKCVGVYM